MLSESLEDVQSLQTLVNGIYRAMYMNAWSTAWSQENPGIMAITLVRDLQGEDHLMSGQGNGWFWYDYTFETDADFTGTMGRQYALWSMCYTIVNQANLVLSARDQLKADSLALSVFAQAYALRSFAYTCLYECFCDGNYPENLTSPGIPLYTEASNIESRGNPRARVDTVLMQIKTDYGRAAELFKLSSSERLHPSHIDLYACYGLWARLALICRDWAMVDSLATLALSKPGLVQVADFEELGHFNDLRAKNLLWGYKVLTAQSSPYGPFLSHMDPEGGYGQNAFQCIDAGLYNRIPDSDLRKTWWESPNNYKYYPYCQLKFRYADPLSFTGDLIYLRAEELLLMKAEAACQQQNYQQAMTLLLKLGAKRDSLYASRLSECTDSNLFNIDTQVEIVSLMDEILFQRRVELWCEGLGRCFDLRRLNLGYDRNYSGSNHTCLIKLLPGDSRYQLLLPQYEIENNPGIDATNQNPR
ncbi:MAG: RagB/SusD family nutrient uptake outer membrane protein [Bacteroidales bacterium]|nr:RagB/SusD family nutrient uptake outer membrane protein [Bacteroidales bacterium]MDD3431100.1 RagB/SusD family nutrient uptake outer membrane protein [Bacteroidales bacterium]